MKPRPERQKAIELRLRGKSYGEIKKILGISSKGTLSNWFRDLVLPDAAKKCLEYNTNLAREKGLLQFNRVRTKKIEEENTREYQQGISEMSTLSAKELFLVGIALYWGEGTKSERNGRGMEVSLANSDPRLIALFMRFVREVWRIPEERIRAGIQVHHNVKLIPAKRFWAGVTGLPVGRFFITKQVSLASKFKRPKRSLPYGTLCIKICNRKLFYRIKGWIEGLAHHAHA